jgi:hypothetical protein
MLKSHGLKGVFFVEALSDYVAGWLKKLVERLRGGSHEVGLHLHTEWLRRAPWVPIPRGKQGGLAPVFR